MKKNYFLFFSIFFFSVYSYGQDSEKRIFNEQFNWSITIPAGFETVDSEEWQHIQNRGLEAIEDTYNQEVIDLTEIVFIFSSGQHNYFESNYQPYDVEIDGDYIETTRAVNEMIYETFRAQLTGVDIDTSATTEIIDNLEFQKFEVEVSSGRTLMKAVMYSRLFDDKEFSVNIMYVDETKGQKMIESWQNSSFSGKKEPDPNFHIYLSFGQSNMEGQGEIDKMDLEVPKGFVTLQAVDCPEDEKVVGNWYTAIPPLSHCNTGLGPGDYFGRTMLEHLPEGSKVGIINVAIGGCDIRLFDKDIYEGYTATYPQDWFLNKVAAYGGNPYKRLVELGKIAQSDGVIKGILLHQGETNTGDKDWPEYVNKIYNDLLTDLSLSADEVPLIAGEVVSAEENCCASMNKIINRLPMVIPTAHVVSSENCTSVDPAHFDAAGYRELGKRYAEKVISLQ